MIPTHGTWYFDLNGVSVAQGLDLNLMSACYMYNDIQYIINACNSTKQTSPTASSFPWQCNMRWLLAVSHNRAKGVCLEWSACHIRLVGWSYFQILTAYCSSYCNSGMFLDLNKWFDCLLWSSSASSFQGLDFLTVAATLFKMLLVICVCKKGNSTTCSLKLVSDFVSMFYLVQ